MAILGPIPHTIALVGSTSIPLPVKPVIDIDIVVAPSDLAPALSALRGGLPPPRGPGYTGARGLRPLPVKRGDVRRNIYVWVPEMALCNDLAVRDTPRADDGLRRTYSEVKRLE